MTAPIAKEGLTALERIRRRRLRSKRRGVALVMVLGAITLLTVFLTQLQEESSAELSAALAEQDALRAEYYARGAVNLSRMLIATEPTIRMGISPLVGLLMGGRKLPQIPVWAFSDMILGAFNDQYGAEAFAGLVPSADYSTAKNLGVTGGGHYDLTIVDEDAKININTVAIHAGIATSEIQLESQLLGLFTPPQYNPIFEGRDTDGQFSDRATICGALIDWADPDENLCACNPTATGGSVGGAEDNFYQTIGLPYRRKNAAFDSLDELRLVRGMNDDFWATFVDPEPSNPKKRIMTVWGQGTINVNTANAMTILAIVCGNAPDTELCIDPIQMQTFVMAITMVRSISMGAPLFASKGDFTNALGGKGMVGTIFAALQLKPVIFKDVKGVQSVISTDSKMFSIYADGVVPGMRKETRVRVHAVVDFRTAMPLGDPMSQILGAQQPPPPSGAPNPNTPAGKAAAANAANAQSNTQDPSQATPEAIQAAMQSNPGGTIVYWRVE